MAAMLRWIYAPEQVRYLYIALFMFGVCFTNHQTLIVAAMGIEVAIAAARPRLGRDLFAINGYDATTTTEILAEACVSRGAMYHHFET